MPRPLKVFLCHASQDKPAVRELYQRLKAENWIDPWLDKAKILPGWDWELVIEKAVDDSDVIVVCVSNQSVNKEGFVQREIRYAYNIALEKPDDTIFLIPLRLDDCTVPRKLRTFHWVDYFDSQEQKNEAISDLLEALKFRYDQILRLEAEVSERRRLEEKARQEADELVKKLALEKAERERLVREAAEKAEKDRAEKGAADKAAREKAEREKAEKDRVEKEAAEIAARKKAEQEKAEKDRVEREATEIAARKKAEQEKAEKDQAEREAAEIAARKKAEKEKAEKDRVEKEAAELATREKVEREKAEKDRAEKEAPELATREKVEREKAEKDVKDKKVPEKSARKKIAEQIRLSSYFRSLKARYFIVFGLVVLFTLFAAWDGFRMNNVIDLSPSALFVSRFTPSKIPSTQTSFSTFTPEPPTLITTVHTVTPTLQVVSQVSEKDNMVMVYVPAGEFTMGGDWHLNEQPIHQVYLDGFWIDQTEVTNAMYAKFLNDNLSKIKIESNVSVTTDPPNKDVNLSGNLIYHLVCTDCIAGWKDHISWNEKVFSVVPGFENSPVVFVNWYGTEAYCSWAGRELPTEAQWEKAARGPNGDIYPWGNDRPNNNFLKLNYNGSGFLTGEVGKYPDGASIYGALDMAGNVSEWVGDWYDENYYKYSPSLNPSGPISGDFRVFRGRTCFSNDESALSYYRDGCTPSWSFSDVGFRCALASP